MKIEFVRQIFVKYSNIKFHKICPEVAELSHANGRTDRHDDANSRSS